jgi:hypothetical protein
MNRLTFWRTFGAVSWALAGCAESAIPNDDIVPDEAPDEGGETDSQLDASTPEDATTGRDSTVTRDSSSPSGGASDAGDAGPALADASLDAGRADAGSDAGRDAATQDAGQPDTGVGPVTCSNGQTTCGNACVNIATDVNNCGGCGTKCASGQTCSSNQCMGGVPEFNVPSSCSKKTLGQHGYAFCTSTRSWRDARDSCLEAGLDLAVVTDKAESDFIKANGDSWIALNDRTNEGRYQHVVPGNRDRVDGANASYTSWKSGEPNNNTTCDGFNIPFIDICAGQRTDEDCGMIYTDGSWNDGACEERRNYVCETY